MNIMESDHETGIVVLCAIRYCIGRRTYMPGLLTDWVRRHWGKLSEKDRALILRDVQEVCDRPETLGDDCDRNTWTSFRDWMITNND